MQDDRMLKNDCCETAAESALSLVWESSHVEDEPKKKRQRVWSATSDASDANNSDITDVFDRDEITSENTSAMRAEARRIFEEDCRKNKIDISKKKKKIEAFKTIYRKERNYRG